MSRKNRNRFLELYQRNEHICGRVLLTIAATVVLLAPASWAQGSSAPTAKRPASASASGSASSATLPGNSEEDPQLYRNATFGFRYKIPYGWVDRTVIMQPGATQNSTTQSDTAQKGNQADNEAGLLLAVFERPPEATGDTVNSAVVIASESAASYPGLKKAEDYVGPLTELAAAKGLKPEGEPYELEVESRQLLRADFLKALAAGASGDKLTMRQCTLVLLAKGRIVSFTFIAGSEDELDDLMDGLHFGVAAKSSVPAKRSGTAAPH
jgi:hypothetical protein